MALKKEIPKVDFEDLEEQFAVDRRSSIMQSQVGGAGRYATGNQAGAQANGAPNSSSNLTDAYATTQAGAMTEGQAMKKVCLLKDDRRKNLEIQLNILCKKMTFDEIIDGISKLNSKKFGHYEAESFKKLII
jgi:hypothetical protein